MEIENDETMTNTWNIKKEKTADYPINGLPHKSVINHHKVMSLLKENETKFTSDQLFELLVGTRNINQNKRHIQRNRGMNSNS